MIRSRKRNSSFLLLILILQLLAGPENPAAQSKRKAAGKPAAAKTSAAGPTGKFAPQPRHALVIGNSSYPGMPLSNTLNDAAVISRSLRAIGFTVTEKKNLTLAAMRGAIEEFSRTLPADAIGMFYFAGHGLQVSGKNFLLPVDYKDVETESDLLATQLDLDSIIAAISKRSGLTIIILDACRNNGVELALSFKSEQGFSTPGQNSGGIYIAYSTSPGKKAYDGIEKNSPYSKALAQNLLLSPGRIEDIFIKTRIDVRNQTIGYPEGEQVPWENGSLSKVFYFTPDKLKNSSPQPSGRSVTPAKLTKPALPFGIKSLLTSEFTVARLDETGSRFGGEQRKSEYFVEGAGLFGLEMVGIPGGRFQMGSSFDEVETAFRDALKSNDEADRDVITAEMPRHLVEVSGFFMSKYEITQSQWMAVMNSLPSNIPADLRGDDKPVVNVSWGDAKKFCDILSQKTGRNYRLPTEAEWEYAARAGTETPFAFGENINSASVNFFARIPFAGGEAGEYRRRTVGIGEINAPNGFGLVNMHGNVWEWCEDYWHWDYNGAPTDGRAWRQPAAKASDDSEDPALYRVIRGGSFDSIGNNCRSAVRRAKPSLDEYKYPDLGFRVVVSN